MIETKSKAFMCGAIEGFFWFFIISIIIFIISTKMKLEHKKYEVDVNIVNKYTLIIICILFITLVSFYSLGYMNKWNSYQKLIKLYKNQGLKDYEIFYLLELELGKNNTAYISALASTSSLLFLGKKSQKDTQSNDN